MLNVYTNIAARDQDTPTMLTQAEQALSYLLVYYENTILPFWKITSDM